MSDDLTCKSCGRPSADSATWGEEVDRFRIEARICPTPKEHACGTETPAGPCRRPFGHSGYDTPGHTANPGGES